MLVIYNSMTKTKEPLKPVVPGEIRMYVCGMTVYDLCHIGHGRIFVVFDMVTRYFRSQGYKVKYVRNITDIDDKIINRANENNESIESLTERTIKAMVEDERALGVERPDSTPRATEFIPNIISMIETLVSKGYAYIAENGDVYFSVKKFLPYGQLAHQEVETLRAGYRIGLLEVKHDPLDFVLWKMSKPHEPRWDSPWGAGRPGWHIECSAMSEKELGKTFDLHGGGMDLQFPHHQNEIAQSEAAHDCQFVKLWMHVGYVQIDEEKMSKSLGNFFTIREVLKEYHPEVVRYFMLASHYRSPINYSHDNLNSARQALQRMYLCLQNLPLSQAEQDSDAFESRYCAAMNDDFNTPEALSVLFEIARTINKLKVDGESDSASQHANLLKRLAKDFGLLQQDIEDYLRGDVEDVQLGTIESLIAQREQARVDKAWSKADEIRNTLLEMGVILEDKPEGTTWRQG